MDANIIGVSDSTFSQSFRGALWHDGKWLADISGTLERASHVSGSFEVTMHDADKLWTHVAEHNRFELKLSDESFVIEFRDGEQRGGLVLFEFSERLAEADDMTNDIKELVNVVAGGRPIEVRVIDGIWFLVSDGLPPSKVVADVDSDGYVTDRIAVAEQVEAYAELIGD